MSTQPGPSRDPEDIQSFRQARPGIYSRTQRRNPWVFASTDDPLQGLAPPQIEQAMQRLASIAGAEGSALVDTDWVSLVDSSLGLPENEQLLLDEGGRLPLEERREDRLTEVDAESLERSRATEEIIELCEMLDGGGVDGVRVLEAIAGGAVDDARSMLAATEFDPNVVADLVDDIEGEFGIGLVVEAIEECRDRLEAPVEAVEPLPEGEVIDMLSERFDIPRALSLDEAIEHVEALVEDLRSELEAAREREAREIEEAAVNRLERALGQRFDSLEDAARRFREQLAQARGERLHIADIRVRVLEDDVRVSIEDGEEFDRFEDLVERRVRRRIDFSGVEPPRTVRVGEITVRGVGEDETVEDIDLERGVSRFGELEEAEDLEPVSPEREQERLEELTEANQRADRAIELLER